MKRDKNRGPSCLGACLYLKLPVARSCACPFLATDNFRCSCALRRSPSACSPGPQQLDNSPTGTMLQEEHWKNRVILVAMEVSSCLPTIVFYLAHSSQLGSLTSKAALLTPWMVTVMVNRWSHRACGDVVLLYLGEVLQSTTCCLQGSQPLLQKVLWRNKNKKNPELVGCNEPTEGCKCFWLTFFFFFFKISTISSLFFLSSFFACSKYIRFILNVEKSLSQSSWNSFSPFINHCRCIFFLFD